MTSSELGVAVFFPTTAVFSGGAERTLKIIEHSRRVNVRFTVFQSEGNIRDREMRRRLAALADADLVTLAHLSDGTSGNGGNAFDAVVIPSEFWYAPLKRSRSLGVRAPVFIEFHQLPYVGTLDVLKTVGTAEPGLRDLLRFPAVSARTFGDNLFFSAYRAAAFYASVRGLARVDGRRLMSVTSVAARQLQALGFSEDFFIPRTPNAIEANAIRSVGRPEALEYDGIFVGRWHAHKGIFDLPVIVAYLKRTLGREVRVAVTGGTQFARDEQRFLKLAADHGVERNLVLLRWLSRSEMYAAVRRSGVLLHPSYVDGFSISVLESLSLGVPVVGYDIDALRTMWSSRRGVFLAPIGDRRALAETAARVLAKEHLDGIRAETERQAAGLLEEYTWEHVAADERRFLDGQPSPVGGAT